MAVNERLLTIPRAVLSAASSDSGKTLVTAAMLRILSRMGYKVQPYKIGPDFIDPMYHTIAAGRASRNLDSWIMDEKTIKRSFGEASSSVDMALVEGVRGLYEGATALGEEGSTAHIAKIIKAPVILVLNCQSLTKSAAAYIIGLKALDKDLAIKGVILNKVSDARHEEKLREAIAYYTDVPVLGLLYRDSSLTVKKRHLGLLTARENALTLELIDAAADALEKNLDSEKLFEIMKSAEPLPIPEEDRWEPAGKMVKVGVISDRAFSFYYPENFLALERRGAKICQIDSALDGNLPEDICGLLIGGGYPEVYAKEIEANVSLKSEIKKKAGEGMPIVGECGGLMYLCRSISVGGASYKMTGIFSGEVAMCDKPQALSYVQLEGIKDCVLSGHGDSLKGHEFHYSAVSGMEGETFAFDVKRGKGITGAKDGATFQQTVGMYTHLHFYATPKPADGFVAACRAYMRK